MAARSTLDEVMRVAAPDSAAKVLPALRDQHSVTLPKFELQDDLVVVLAQLSNRRSGPV